MNNQKIPTGVGTIIIVIIAITVGMFVWKYEKNQENAEIQTSTKNQQDQSSIAPEEFPTVPIQPGISLEDIIKQAIYKKSPQWKTNNYSISVTVEINKEDHAIGRFTYDGYNGVQDEKYHNIGEQVWFAAKSDNSWTLAEVSGAGYWGSCQDFKKYNFPLDMTPDCWDTDKNVLIDTSNPKEFYPDGFVKADKKALVQAFILFIKKQKDLGEWEPDSYLQKDLYVKIDKKVGNYITGTILVGGRQNISAPYFLAVKQNGKWIVVHNGQDVPNCNAVEPYKFPHEIIGTCYDEINKKEKEVL